MFLVEFIKWIHSVHETKQLPTNIITLGIIVKNVKKKQNKFTLNTIAHRFYSVNQWAGFYMITASVMKKLKGKSEFFS